MGVDRAAASGTTELTELTLQPDQLQPESGRMSGEACWTRGMDHVEAHACELYQYEYKLAASPNKHYMFRWIY